MKKCAHDAATAAYYFGRTPEGKRTLLSTGRRWCPTCGQLLPMRLKPASPSPEVEAQPV